MINDYSLPKVFYEDLYKAFIFHVEHPRKVFIYICVTLKKYEFSLTFKKAVLKKGICIKKKVVFILQKKWMKLEQGTESKSKYIRRR